MRKRKNSEKTILIVTEYFVPRLLGLSKFSLFLAKRLIKDRHSVTVLTTQFQKKLKREEHIGKINVIREPCLFKISRTHYSLAIVWKFLKIKRKFDAVFINSPNSNILPFSVIAKLARKKLVIVHHGDLILPRRTGSPLLNLLIERSFDVATFLSSALADNIATQTKDYAKHSRVMRFFLHKFVPYIRPHPLLKEKPTKTFSKKIRKLKKGHVLIGFAGRFVEEKGFDILLGAIPFVIKKIPNSIFVFSGETNIGYESFYELNMEVIKRNKKHVKFLGLLDDPDFFEFYRNLDVFVISSRSDCFPSTQIEAALSGVPIVVTDIPGARMLVRETGFGVIVKPEDPQSLASGIIEAVQNRAKYLEKFKNIEPFVAKYGKLRFGL